MVGAWRGNVTHRGTGELKLVPGLVREARGGQDFKVTRSGDDAGVDDRQLRCEFGLLC